MVQLERTQDGTRETTQQQDAIERAINRSVPSWFRSSVLLEDVDLVAGTNTKVAHKLGREMRGFLLADNLAASVNRVTRISGQSDTDTYITLACDVNCTVALVVF